MSPSETTRRCVTVQDQDEIQAILAEAETTTDTADKLANGDYPEEADHTRVLAGLIKQTSEQVERLARAMQGARTGS
jgi:DNA-binding MarR family transcriptional regulator